MTIGDQAPPPSRRAIKRSQIVIVAVVVVALVSVSLLAFVFYIQAQDYRGAKYRAQYVLVMEIYGSIPQLDAAMENVLDESLDNGFRRSAAMYAQGIAESISGACHAIEVMYPASEEKSIVFSELSAAFLRLSETAMTAYDQLTDPTPELSEAIRTALGESSDIAMEVRSLIIVGVDLEVSLEDVSYDLLERMDLTALAAAAEELQAAQP